MYAWLWGRLPGPLYVRVLQAAALLAAVVTVLLFVVFPQVEAALPYNDVTVGRQGPVPAATATR